MRKNLGDAVRFFPQPLVLIATYDEDGTPNVMAAAWAGIKDYHEVCFACSAGHKTTQNFLKTKAFTISFAEEGNIAESDFFGIASGNDSNDKVAKVGFTFEKSETVNAPIIKEYKVALECELLDYSAEHGFTVGLVKNVVADESVLDGENIDITKLKPVVYDGESTAYFKVGEKVADAFSCGNKFMEK